MVRERMVKVMFSVLLLIGCLGWLSHGAWGATEIGTATITEDTVWGPEGSPYIVQRLSINQGVTLTLDPGTILKFRSNGFIDILGRLNINGNDQDLVILTSYYDDTAGGDTDGGTTSPNKGDWGDLNIAAGGELVCNYAKIVYGGRCSHTYRYNSITINNGGKAGIYDSEISNSYWVGIKNSGDLLVERTIISNGNTGLDNIKNAVIRGSKLTALDTGVKISGGQLDLTGSTIENNKVGVNYTSSATLPYIRENNFINNQTAVKNNNSNITLDCTWNYWNHEGGPSTLLNNVWTDLGDRIEGKISYEPWYTSKVTGGAEPVRIRIEGIIEGAKINTDPEIKVIVSDGVLIGTYLDGVAWSPGDAITEGAHTFKAVAENFEQQQRIVEISFSLDKTPPRAVIDNGAIIQATTSKAISISALQSTDNNNTISSYTWTFSDTEQQYNGSTIWRTFTTAGEYTVTLVVKDNHGNESEPVEARIVVGDAPVIEISGVEHGGRYNQDLEVGIAVTNGASTGITLNGNALSETSFTVSVEGYYTLVVNAQNESGITATKTVSFRLDKTPPVAKLNPERTVYADDEIILNGGLSSDISGIAEYLWSISGDSDTYEGYTVKKIFNEPGDYSVSLQVCDNCGNWSLTPSVMTLHVIEHSAEVTFNGVNDGRKYNQPVQVEIIVKYGSIKSLTLNGQECPTNFSVNDEGDYTLKVVAVGADQEEKTFIARFSIDKTPPVALIDRSVPVQGYDDNRPVAFNAGQCADNTGIVTYEWSFSDREQKYFGKSVSRVFSTSGEFIATLVVIDGYGNRSVPDYLNFEIKSKGNTAITIGGVEDNGAYTQSVPIQVTVENGTLKRIVLDDQEQTDTGFTVSGEGIHTLRVEAINESEYTTVKGIRFTIDTIPPVAMAVANRIITEGETLTLYGSGKDHSGISEYKWIFSDGQEFFGQTFTKENLSRGEYTASLFVKDGCGNWSVEPAMVNIMVKLRPVQLEITGVKPNMYTNQDVTIGVKATYGTIASITLNGAPYAPDAVISAEGKYILEIVAFNEAQEETRGSLVFNIDKTAPVANAGPDLKCFNDGEAVTFKGLESQDNLGVAKFEWSFSDGKKLQGPLVYKGFTQPGTYTVTLVVTDMAGNVSQPDTCQIEVTDMGNTEILVTGVEPNGRYNHDVSLQVQVLEGTLQKFQIDKEIIQASTATITCDGWRQIEIEAISPTGYVLTKRFKIGIDKTVPVADAGGDRRGYINQPVYFDGGFSSDNSGIAEFIWEFSDGATAMGRTVQHSFTQKGIYYADLKVKDGFGNWSPQSNRVQVEVRDPGELSVLRIAVKDQSQRPLVDSIIIIEDVSGKQFKQVTDDQGFATELLEPNDYKIYAYQPGYKTDTKEITVGERVNLEESFVLEQGSDVITLVESRQLDLDEIKALGIDTSLPENRFIFKFTFKVGYQELPLEYLSNGLNEISKIESEEDNTGKGWELKGFGDGEFDLFGHVSVIIRGTASVLKEFYELKMTIANGADESVSLDSILLNLDLPQGLALAPIPESRQITNGDIIRKQSMQVDAGSISGQSQKTIIWVLRGDEGGSYQPAIDYLGILNPFGTEIKDTAVLKDPIQVEDPSKLVLKTFAPDLIYRNQPFDMLFELVNTGNKPFYDAYLQIDEVEILDETLVLLSNIPDLIVRKESLQPGEKISLAVKFMPLISGVCCNKELVQSGGNVKFSSTIIPDCPHFVKAYEEQEGITLKWVQAANGLYYIIRRRLAGEEDFKVINSAVFGESFTDTNVEDFKTYEYTVSTVNWDGEESMTVSEIVKATAGKITTDPDQGQHNTPIKVSLFTGTSNLPIYYTTDGTDPVPGTSPLYSGPISVDQLTLIKAVAVNGDAVSRVFEFKFYIGTVLRGDFVEGYWSDCGTNEAERENLGDKYRLALSDLLIYDWTQDPPPGYLREMPSNSWTAETIVKLENFIDGSQFASGILVTQGDEVISWGYYEGANLGLTNRNHKPIKISYGETQVRLRLRKERNILYFEYRGSTDEPWRLGGSRILTDEPVKAGVYSRTWSKPQPLQTEYIGFMVIEKPEMDQAWEWRQPVEGPSYQVTAKNAFIMTVPDSRTFRQNKSRDYAPQIIRKDITGMNWRFSALQEVIENSEDSFFTGLMVTLPDYDRIYFGCEGNELVVRRSTKMLFNVTLNSAEPLELLIERQGTRFIFSYRLQSDGSWLVLGKTDLTLPVVEIGMVTKTDAPQNVVTQFSNIMVEQTTEDLDQQWTWDSGTPGTSYQVLGKDSIAVNVSDVTYFDDSNQDHLTSGLRQAVGDIDWSIATEVSMLDLENEEHYLAGIQVLLSATDIISWGITDSGLRLERGNIGIADFSGVQLPVNLRVRKTGSLINFEYLDTTNETWNTAYVFEAPIIPIRIGVAVKTATATFCNAVFNELRFKRLLPAGWEWYTPISGPEYRIESDNQISLRLPGDKAYPFTLTKDHAPQLRKDPAQLDLTGDWSLSAIATLREFTSGVVFRSRLMVYFSPDQILQWGFYNGTSLRGDWEKKVAGVENNATTVELRIRKVGDVYNLEYRYSEGDPWTLAGKTMITETPQKVGWIVSSNRATSVVTEIQLPKLKENIAKYPVNIRVINEKWGTPIWNALIKLNGETLVQYGLGCTAVLPAGSHPVTVTAPGYLDYQGIIEITQAVNLEIKLKPEIELPEVRIVGINPAFDVTTGELRVNAEILAGGSDSILWLRISLLDGSNQVLASLKGQVFARAGEFIQIKPEDWVFVLGEQPSRIRLEVLSGDDPETVLTVGDVMMNE